MRRNLALLSLVMALVSPIKPAHCGELRGGLLKSLDTISFEIILGRVTAQAARYRHSRTHAQQDQQTELQESLSLHIHAGIPTLHYDCRDDQQRLSIDVTNGNELEIELQSSRSDASPRIHFVQPRTGTIQLTIVPDGNARVLEAPSLWHLLLAHPDECHQHLVPLLGLLRGDWQLDRKAVQLEAELLQVALNDLPLNEDRVTKLIERLRDPEYIERQRAMHELRRCGFAVLPLLDTLDTVTLDREQRVRLRQIREQLMVATGDSPARVAAWLCCDQAVWLTLLARPDERTCVLAREHLSRLYDRPIAFEYVASDEERARQVDRLRGRLERR